MEILKILNGTNDIDTKYVSVVEEFAWKEFVADPQPHEHMITAYNLKKLGLIKNGKMQINLTFAFEFPL